jgi:hypothetical protein
MTRRALVLLFVVCVLPVTFAPLYGQTPADQISGIWTDGDGRGLDLKFDGKNALSGKLNPGRPNEIPIKEGTFDPKTGVFQLKAERTVNGATQHMAIDGKLANGKLTGSYDADGQKGTFEFTKKQKQ